MIKESRQQWYLDRTLLCEERKKTKMKTNYKNEIIHYCTIGANRRGQKWPGQNKKQEQTLFQAN